MGEPDPPAMESPGPRPATKIGLKNRVVLAFAFFGFTLACVFAILMWSALHIAEDRIVIRYLELELEGFLSQRHQGVGDEALLPATRWLHSTFDPSTMPGALQAYASKPDGAYELAKIGATNEPFLLIHTLEEGRRLFLYLDAKEIEVIDASFTLIGTILLFLLLFVIGFGIALGRMTARRAIAPVVELAEQVQRFDVRRNEIFDSSRYAADEVGLLARALADSTARSQAFLERERRFTRDASHELRSPVTVVRGAVELLETLPEAGEPRLSRPLGRIRRASAEMERLIDAFLWLAREEALSAARRPQSLEAEVDAALERHRHLLEGKSIEIVRRLEPACEIQAPDGILGIVIGNLIANACFFTQEGRITLLGDAEKFQVLDSGPGIPAEKRHIALYAHERGQESDGFGLGLAIVNDLCERFGWRLELAANEAPESTATGTSASVYFTEPQNGPEAS